MKSSFTILYLHGKGSSKCDLRDTHLQLKQCHDQFQRGGEESGRPSADPMQDVHIDLSSLKFQKILFVKMMYCLIVR